MARQPKETPRHGQPSGFAPDKPGREPRRKSTSGPHFAEAALPRQGRVPANGSALATLTSQTSSVDRHVHPEGGRQLLDDAERTVQPLIPRMFVRG